MAMRMMLAGLGLAVLAALPAMAAPVPKGGVTADEMAALMRELKLPVELRTDRQGDPLILSTIRGRRFGVYFYNCENARCGSIQFAAEFDRAGGVPMVKVMDWNRTKRFGRAYADRGSLFVEMDMDVEIGATTEGLANNFARWAVVVEQFPKFFE